jgi:hypothetical protein
MDIAATLAEAIVQSTNLLRARLEGEGVARAASERFLTDECLIECMLFEWFLHDAVIILEFGRHAETIRHALAGRLLIELYRGGLGMHVVSGLDGRRGQRFAEYAEATAAGESLQSLGSLACTRIFGRTGASERGTMLLARQAGAQLVALRGLGKALATGSTVPNARPP